MDAYRNLREELDRMSENSEESERQNRRTSSADSGFQSENESRRTSNDFNNGTSRPTASNNNSQPNGSNDDLNGGDIAAGLFGIAGIALGAYAVGKLLFGGSDSKPSGRMTRILEDEEEIPISRRKPRYPHDYFNPSYIARISREIKRDTNEYPVVGLDCQWTQGGGGNYRNRIELLQVSSHNGKVALIRLCKGQKIPPELLTILADKNIIKSGIETLKDAQFLLEDYSINVKGTYDLRFLAEANGHLPESLAKLAKKILDIDLGRDFDLIASNWNATNLSQEQIDYAIKAAKASVDIFKALISKVMWWPSKSRILSYCSDNLDKKYIYRSENYK